MLRSSFTPRRSSRSHVVVVHTSVSADPAQNTVKKTPHAFVDLAGSENFSCDVDNSGISLGVHALANCLNALANNQKHVPFCDSVVTHLLKPYLLSSATTIIACLNQSSAAETRNTIRYASAATKISIVAKNPCQSSLHGPTTRWAEALSTRSRKTGG